MSILHKSIAAARQKQHWSAAIATRLLHAWQWLWMGPAWFILLLCVWIATLGGLFEMEI
jgi:hypothetical protein